ncbi:helix-hairpin-helix domain-containing protein [Sphingobacterium bambusae]|uniref:Helix-hairpin-helix domain-containing protein n=1 Tax=Sphingobacterium bambusae TaxID=662858 RepID=A0ABW6BNJ9_9SPHI|nr:helix-hairpin-helix domain-containing protein [Sphingobacterium bambusae]WPL47760.1 helix-hairpin-helix domain-containing protein [Sphingobacterium bambusae]
MKKLALLFKLTAHEQRGFVLLLCGIVLLQFLPLLHRVVFRSATALEPLVRLEELKAENAFDNKGVETVHVQADAPEQEHTYAITPFNPNDLSEERWRAMGFSDKQIRGIKNYERKGGRFRSAADVAKMYTISAKDFQRIAPFLRFNEELSVSNEQVVRKTNFVEKERVKILPLNINEADTLAWQTLPGIGPVLSSRIVKFRDLLGGFYNIDQVAEVYGITAETFEGFKTLLFLGKNAVKQLPINQLSEQELARHPYISARNARYIVRYREQHGALQSMEDLKKIYALDPDFLLKIEPYLQFN